MQKLINGVLTDVIVTGKNGKYGENLAPENRLENFNPSSSRIDTMCFPPEGTGNTFDRLQSFQASLNEPELFNGLNSYPKSNTVDLSAVDNATKSAIDEGYQLLVNLEHGALPANGGILGGSGRYALSTDSNLEEIYQSYLLKDVGITTPEDQYYTQFYNYLVLIKQQLITKGRSNLIVYLTALHEANDIQNTYIWSKGNIFLRLKSIKYLIGKMIDEIFPHDEFPNIFFIDWLNRFNGGDRLWSVQNLFIKKSEWKAQNIKCSLMTGTTIYNRAGTSPVHLYDLNFGYSSNWILGEMYSAELGTEIAIPEISTNNNKTFFSDKPKWMADCANYLLTRTPLKIRTTGSFLITIDAGGTYERSWGWKTNVEREVGVNSLKALKNKTVYPTPLQTLPKDNLISNPFCLSLSPTASPWYRLDTANTITTPTFLTKSAMETAYPNTFRWLPTHPEQSQIIEILTDGGGNGKDAVWNGTSSADPNATRQRLYFEVPASQFTPVPQQVFLVALDVCTQSSGMYCALGVRNSTGGTYTFHKELGQTWETIYAPAILKAPTTNGNLMFMIQVGHNTVASRIWMTNFRMYQLKDLNYVDVFAQSQQQLPKSSTGTFDGESVVLTSTTAITGNTTRTFIWNSNKITRYSKINANVTNSSIFAGDVANTAGQLVINHINVTEGVCTVVVANTSGTATNGAISLRLWI
jgi:hypothetical protein